MASGADLSDLKKVFDDIGSYFTNLDSLGKTAWIMILVGIILLVVGAFFW